MKLLELFIEPQGEQGWGSRKLIFGDKITKLYGPNGCGKTPVVEFFVFCLGYPVTFRNDIYARCKSANLAINIHDQVIRITREINKGFVATLSTENEKMTYYNEADFSAFLFQAMNMKVSYLVSKDNKPVMPYMATILPLFYLDQEHGYTEIYKPKSSFIKDQYSEMMRLAFDIVPKHHFDKKRELIEAKRKRGILDKKIIRKREVLESIAEEVDGKISSITELERDISSNLQRINNFKKHLQGKGRANSAVESLVFQKEEQLNNFKVNLLNDELKLSGLDQIRNEIEVELKTLALNEEARLLFQSFQDLCSKHDCGLFLGSSESYGKSLLYLKDQAKDLSNISGALRESIESYKKQISSVEDELSELISIANESKQADETESLIQAISELTKRTIDLQRDKTTRQQYERENNRLIALEDNRSQTQDLIATLERTGRGVNLRLVKLRQALKEEIPFWLDILDTKNLSRAVNVDSNFQVTFDGETIQQLKGSTRIRVILAIHASIFSIHINDNDGPFRFFVLDTPKQQEIHANDLINFISEIDRIAGEKNAQVIFSCTEFDYEIGENDQEWAPSFTGFDQEMFLGKISP